MNKHWLVLPLLVLPLASCGEKSYFDGEIIDDAHLGYGARYSLFQGALDKTVEFPAFTPIAVTVHSESGSLRLSIYSIADQRYEYRGLLEEDASFTVTVSPGECQFLIIGNHHVGDFSLAWKK